MSLIKNDEYSIKELFSTEHRKIVIPDFQRDYCWGNKDYGDNKDTNIVSGFIDTLFEEEKNGKTVLGKIDVYENPTNHVNLTDGQQRLTTIYLLIGMLLKKADLKKADLKKCLLSDFEETDDKEPYLQYSIRESSVFFLRDLVTDFFIKENDLQVKDIENQPWHFNEYALDPTIQSFKEALKTIEDKLKWKSTNEIDSFSDFVLNDLKIQYYNVGDRKHGEERFVIINTTGKGLTTTENIKPILLGSITDKRFAKEWEERETFFWKNRIKDKESTADNGVNDFMTWCFQIIEQQDGIDLVKTSKRILKPNKTEEIFIKIHVLFKAFKNLLELTANSQIQKQLQFINDGKEVITVANIRSMSKDKIQDVILPLLLIITKINIEEVGPYQFLRRLRKNYFDKKWIERKSNYIDWRNILKIIENSLTIDECLTYPDEFVKIDNVEKPIGKWFNSEEKLKVLLKKENQELIELWEDHQDFMGDLSFLFQVFLKRKEGIDNTFSSLNKEFGSISLSLADLEYLQTLKIEKLKLCFDLYKRLLKNKLFNIIEIRFNRQNQLWSGIWSLSRDYFEYRRWHKKHTGLIYQNWFYFVIGEIIYDEEDMDVLLKTYIKNIFSQSSKIFFETDLHFEEAFDFEQFSTNLTNKYKSTNNNGFYYWNGFLWYCLLAINEPEKAIDFEIVFDIFDRKKDHFLIGNQFVWTKGYYDKSIKTYDNFKGVNWDIWKNINKEDEGVKDNFIKNRESLIKSLFEISLLN